MKKKNIKPIVISALLAAAFGATSVGTSFALFTDSAETSINVTAGKVDVSGGLTGLVVYSAEANASGTVLDENNAKYNLVAQTATDAQGHTLFANKGYAGIATTTTANDTLNLVNVTPGDKVAFKFDMSNASNVTIKYRVVYEVVNTGAGYLDLVKGLTTTIGEESFTGLKTFKSAWTVAENGVLDDVDLSIYLPMDKGNIYQNKAASIKLSVEAVQGNAVTTEGRVVETIEEEMTTSAVSTGAAIVLEAANPEQSVAVKTTIPENTTETPDGKKVELIVSDLTQATEEESTEKSLEFDLTLKVNGEVVESFSKLIDVEIDIGPGYKITSITHKDSTITPYDATTNPNGYTYDINEGIIRFKTDTFSPFVVTYARNVIDVMTYEQLQVAVAQPYAIVRMSNDINIPMDTSTQVGTAGDRKVYGPARCSVAKGVIVNGGGHKLVTPNFYVDGTTLYAIATHIFLVNGADITFTNLNVDCSNLYNASAIIDCNGKSNIRLLDSSFVGSMDFIGAGKVLKNVKTDLTISGVSVRDTFAFIYESSGNILDGSVIIQDSDINTNAYTVNFGSGVTGNAKLKVKDTTLSGWTSYAGLDSAIFENVEFKHSGTLSADYNMYMNYFRNYCATEFNGCVFNVEIENTDLYYGFYIDPSSEVRNDAEKTVFNNCKIRYTSNGVSTSSIEDLSVSNIFKFKEAHEFNCTLNGTGYHVSGTEATVLA